MSAPVLDQFEAHRVALEELIRAVAESKDVETLSAFVEDLDTLARRADKQIAEILVS